MNLPNNAEAFVSFMETVWSDYCEPSSNGLIIYGHPLYNEWHNARTALQRCGAHRSGTTRVDGEHWPIYRFPADDGRQAIRVRKDGTAIKISTVQFGRRR